jgi:hypothetical protein
MLLSSDAGARQFLATQANHIAQQVGKPAGAASRVVRTNHRAAVSRDGSGTEIADASPVYVVQVDGSFARNREDRKATGTVLELMFDAVTGELTDLGLRSNDGNLARLGPISTLS